MKFFYIFFISVVCFSQSSGVGTKTPESSAVFEIKSVTGGFLAPRMTQSERDAIVSPASGLMIYNTDVKCYEFWNGTEWFNTCVLGKLDPSSNGTSQVSSYDCSGSSGGVLNAGVASSATQQLTVTVVRKGSYAISTGVVNGAYFTDTGFFDSIGTKIITLTSYGVPVNVGTFSYSLNTTPSCSFNRIVTNPSLLSISSQPVDLTEACTGTGVVSLSVSASGTTGITYSWRRNGAVLSNDAVISGAATNTLKLTGPRASDSGQYDVLISGDSTTPISSSYADVVVYPSPVVLTTEQKICLPGTANLTLAGVTLGSTPSLSYSYFTDAAGTIPYLSPLTAPAGTYYIKGTMYSLNCFDIKSVVVTSNSVAVAAIGGGSASVAVDNTTPAFTNATAGGIWSVENGTGAATIDSSGVLTGVSVGSVNVVYTVTNQGCASRSIQAVSINAGGFIPGNSLCTSKTISRTRCSSVAGAVLNDDSATPLGVEYDWAAATSPVLGVGFGATTGTRALVEIGGQCWARYNSDVVNANDQPAVNDGIDRGSSDYYNNAASEPAANEGLLYQWSAAMNGRTAESSQGVCPTGWHVPSDCEWMFLENTLGMSVSDQVSSGSSMTRPSGTVGSKLKSGGDSGFSVLMSGYGNRAPTFFNRGLSCYFWSSSDIGTLSIRKLDSSTGYIFRYTENKTKSFSVRCLKD